MIRTTPKPRHSRHPLRTRRVALEGLERRELLAGDTPECCIDFEDLAVGTSIGVGGSFVADSIDLQASFRGEPFTFSSGTPFAGGFARVENVGLAGHVGHDIQVNNILLNVVFSGPQNDLTLNFGEYGGNLNLEINGDARNFENFQDVHGMNVGGTTVTVPMGGTGQDRGVLKVSGTINSFKIGGQELWIDHLCVGRGGEGGFDWGDAPLPYPTLAASNGARHVISGALRLGTQLDAELDGQPSPGAVRDDLVGVDDEDGVKFLTPLVPGNNAQVGVVATAAGRLDAWVDFDGSGSWDPSEQIFASQPVAAGNNVLVYTVPATALPTATAPTYARFRLSSGGGLAPDGGATDGEVEDYEVRIQRLVVPPVIVPVPVHWTLHIVPVGQNEPVPIAVEGLAEIWFGTPVNPDNGDTFPLFVPDENGILHPNAVPNANSQWTISTEIVSLSLTGVDPLSGDRILIGLRPEDSPLPGGPSTGEIRVSSNGQALAYDSFFDVFFEITIDDGAQQMAIGNPTAIRLQETSDGQTGPLGPPLLPDDVIWIPTFFWEEGLANELLDIQPPHPLWDVLVEIHGEPSRNFDWGDAPDKPYPTLAVNNGAVHQIDPDVFLGQRVDGELDGQPNLASTGDDINPPTADDEDGVKFLTPLIPGAAATVEVVASVKGSLNAWIDFDGNGSWSPAEQIFAAQPLNPGSNVLSFNVPNTAVTDADRVSYSRWRFSTTHAVLGPAGANLPGTPRRVPDGEVEDHAVAIQALDFGDAPDQPYPTRFVNDGARHVIRPDYFMGAGVDPDPDGAPTVGADGDDLLDGNDDEDGVKLLTPLAPGTDVLVEIEVSEDGFVDAWVDFDQNGVWDASEQIFASELLIIGTNVESFVVPAGAIPEITRPVYARFRFSSTGGLATTGLAEDGEVEDYAYRRGDLNGDGVIDDQDIDLLCRQIVSEQHDPAYDLNGDGKVNDDDQTTLVEDILGTTRGDADLDGLVRASSDGAVLLSHLGMGSGFGWADADFNCDGQVTASGDGALLLAGIGANDTAAATDSATATDRPTEPIDSQQQRHRPRHSQRLRRVHDHPRIAQHVREAVFGGQRDGDGHFLRGLRRLRELRRHLADGTHEALVDRLMSDLT